MYRLFGNRKSKIPVYVCDVYMRKGKQPVHRSHSFPSWRKACIDYYLRYILTSISIRDNIVVHSGFFSVLALQRTMEKLTVGQPNRIMLKRHSYRANIITFVLDNC